MERTNSRKLIASAVMILASVALLLGLTFAWFTDSVSNKGNKIQAGTLAIQLNDGKTEPILSSEGKWEPGYSEKANATVKNTGNLWLKYTIGVENVQVENPDGVAANIGDVLDVYQVTADATSLEGATKLGTVTELAAGRMLADGGVLAPAGQTGTVDGKEIGDTEALNLVVKMQEGAGNQYQGAGITFDVVVKATQYTYEEDGFGSNQYDAGATLPVGNAKEAAAVLSVLGKNAGGANVSITLDADVDKADGIVTANGDSLAIDFGGNEMAFLGAVGSSGTATNGMQLKQGSTVSLTNGTYKADPNCPRSAMLIQNYSNLTLRDVTLDGTTLNVTDVSTYTLSNNCGNTLITGNTNILARSGHFAFDSYKFDSYPAPTVTIDENMTGTIDGKIEVTGGNLVVKGGTFMNTGMTLDQFKAYVAEGYAAVDNGDGSWTVKAA